MLSRHKQVYYKLAEISKNFDNCCAEYVADEILITGWQTERSKKQISSTNFKKKKLESM